VTCVACAAFADAGGPSSLALGGRPVTDDYRADVRTGEPRNCLRRCVPGHCRNAVRAACR